MNTWLENKAISVVPRGLMAGTIVSKLTFSEVKATNGELRSIFEFVVMNDLKSRGVLLEGIFTDENANAFEALVKTLLEGKYDVFVFTDGMTYLPFMSKQGVYCVAELESTEWKTHPVKEVHYVLHDGSSVEPIIPPKCSFNYIIPKCALNHLKTFVMSSKVAWKICPEVVGNFDILLKEA